MGSMLAKRPSCNFGPALMPAHPPTSGSPRNSSNAPVARWGGRTPSKRVKSHGTESERRQWGSTVRAVKGGGKRRARRRARWRKESERRRAHGKVKLGTFRPGTQSLPFAQAFIVSSVCAASSLRSCARCATCAASESSGSSSSADEGCSNSSSVGGPCSTSCSCRLQAAAWSAAFFFTNPSASPQNVAKEPLASRFVSKQVFETSALVLGGMQLVFVACDAD